MGSSSKMVCVVGAGLAGLVSACELLREGHEVTVIEQRHDVEWASFNNKEMGIGSEKLLKLFVPIAVLAFSVLVPVNWTSGTLEDEKSLSYDQIDKLSISNIGKGSKRFWAHIVMAYVFTFWTFYVLYHEYKVITTMRLRFLANQKHRPDQFTVLVRNIPEDSDETVSEHVQHFFAVNHRDHYLSHQVVYNANTLASLVEKKTGLQNWLVYYENQHAKNPAKNPAIKTGLWGLWGEKVDAIEYYRTTIEELCKQEDEEREKVVSDPSAIMPAAFVSFKSQWGATVCAQTQQTSNPTVWITEWAPEPRNVYWPNLAIPFVSLSVRRLMMTIALFFLTFFFMVPIALVQSLANLDDIERVLPFLKPIIQRNSLRSIIQGFLPGIALKIFLIILPTILMTMSKIEGHISLSGLDRRTASKYFLFLFVNVFLGSVITGTAFQQLDTFIHQPANKIPETVGESIPMKAIFFITYIMVDGWSGIAAEVLRLKPLVMFHIKNTFLVRTDQDREQAMDPGSLDFGSTEPRIQLYFLLGLVYAVVTPILLPFIIVFFSLAYLVFRHQEAMVKDTLQRATDPTLNLRVYLKDAYVPPVFHRGDMYELVAMDEEEKDPLLVATKRRSRMNTPVDSRLNSSSGTNEGEFSRLRP
ncbi:hypothetical protein ACQ4PT_003360 [Festuca glaucescens]